MDKLIDTSYRVLYMCEGERFVRSTYANDEYDEIVKQAERLAKDKKVTDVKIQKIVTEYSVAEIVKGDK